MFCFLHVFHESKFNPVPPHTLNDQTYLNIMFIQEIFFIWYDEKSDKFKE